MQLALVWYMEDVLLCVWKYSTTQPFIRCNVNPSRVHTFSATGSERPWYRPAVVDESFKMQLASFPCGVYFKMHLILSYSVSFASVLQPLNICHVRLAERVGCTCLIISNVDG